ACIHGSASEAHSHYFAAAVAFPGWAGVVDGDFAFILCGGVKHGLGRLEHPSGPVPDVDLHSNGVSVEIDLVAVGYLEHGWDCWCTVRSSGRAEREQRQRHRC